MVTRDADFGPSRSPRSNVTFDQAGWGGGSCYNRVVDSAGTSRIEINPEVMQGKRVIRNTRIPVELVLRKLPEGETIADILDGYPRLTENDIRACLAYTAEAIAHETVHPLVSC